MDRPIDRQTNGHNKNQKRDGWIEGSDLTRGRTQLEEGLNSRKDST